MERVLEREETPRRDRRRRREATKLQCRDPIRALLERDGDGARLQGRVRRVQLVGTEQ